MRKGVIEKIIKLNDSECPEFTYSNPLLDKNVSTAVSKSIMETLYKNNEISRKKNVRTPMLQSIRKMCKTAPIGHVEIDEHLTEALTSTYEKQITNSTRNKHNIGKQLDAFLIRKSKSINLNSSFQPSVNPEVLQSLLNLNVNGVFSEDISKDIIHWNIEDQKYRNVLQNLWYAKSTHDNFFYDNASIKMKSNLESVLLNVSNRLLEQNNLDNKTLFSECDMNTLVNACSISAECFQICTSILNSLFITTNFNTSIENFIFSFIQNVKSKAKPIITNLYPISHSNLITILDLNLDELDNTVRESYVMLAKNHLKSLHEKSENDLIMLLSHFPQWFNIYFDEF